MMDREELLEFANNVRTRLEETVREIQTTQRDLIKNAVKRERAKRMGSGWIP